MEEPHEAKDQSKEASLMHKFFEELQEKEVAKAYAHYKEKRKLEEERARANTTLGEERARASTTPGEEEEHIILKKRLIEKRVKSPPPLKVQAKHKRVGEVI